MTAALLILKIILIVSLGIFTGVAGYYFRTINSLEKKMGEPLMVRNK